VHPICVDAYVKGGDRDYAPFSLSSTIWVPSTGPADQPSLNVPCSYNFEPAVEAQTNQSGNTSEHQAVTLGNEDAIISQIAEEPNLSPSNDFHFWNDGQTISEATNPAVPTTWPSFAPDDQPLPMEAACCASIPEKRSINEIEETTLCSIAFQLVHQFNTKSHDIIEIGLRLWRGFRKESYMGEGCRVDSKLLLEVLNDISSVSSGRAPLDRPLSVGEHLRRATRFL
jgi:hypothetical protein